MEESHCGGITTIARSDISFAKHKLLKYKYTVDFKLSETIVVTRLAWSPWFKLSSPLSPSTFDEISLLAVSMSDGSVYLIKLSVQTSINEPSGNWEILADEISTVIQRQRIVVTKLTWRQWNGNLVLAVARNGYLTLSIHAIEAFPALSSKVVSCKHNNFSPAIGTFRILRS